jgi:lipopolysaccharide transport protein LptA
MTRWPRLAGALLGLLLIAGVAPAARAADAEEPAPPDAEEPAPSATGAEPATATAEQPAQAQGPAAAQKSAARLGLTIDSRAPMDIEADELEAVRGEAAGERVVFRKNVRVKQEDLRISCDWLEAVYPKQAGGRPDRIRAKGNVHMRQADTEVVCEEAEFGKDQCQLECMGGSKLAVLKRGDDIVRGTQIDFDLCSGTLRVKGARLQIRPKPAQAAKPEQGAE